MIQDIARGYKTLGVAVAKVVLLLIACTALGAAIVYPLWYFATSAPVAYTIAMLVIIGVTLLFVILARMRTAGTAATITAALRVAVVLAGIVAIVALVLHGKRFFAIPVVIVALILYGVLSFGREKK